MDWKEHYKRNTVTADEAIALVSPGDNVAISLDPKPTLLMDILASQHKRLADLRIFDIAPAYNPGWLHADFEGSYRYSPSMFLGPLARPGLLRTPYRFCSRNLHDPTCSRTEIQTEAQGST